MAKARWIKNHIVNKHILEMLRKKRIVLTTNHIMNLVADKHDMKLDWKTINRYLIDLETGGHIIRQIVRGTKKNINLWRIKPEE